MTAAEEAADFRSIIAAGNNLDSIVSKMNSPLMQEMELLAEAMLHAIRSLRPSERWGKVSYRMCQSIRYFAAQFHSAVNEYNSGLECRHYCFYFLDLSSEIHCKKSEADVLASLETHGKVLENEKAKLKESRRKEKVAERHNRLHELAKTHGLRAVGHIDPDRVLLDVICVDAYTHRPLDICNISIEGIDDSNLPNDTNTASVTSIGGEKKGLPRHPRDVSRKKAEHRVSSRESDAIRSTKTKLGTQMENDPTIPLPSMNNPFPPEGFVNKNMLDAAGFKVFDRGTVYGFTRAPNGVYSMVWAVQFSPAGSFSPIEKEAVDVSIEYLSLVQSHAHQVKNNRAQNGNKAPGAKDASSSQLVNHIKFTRHRRLFGCGWRPGRAPGEAAGEYAPQSQRDKHDPEGYIDMHEKQELVNVAWIILQEQLSPRAVMRNIETLADTPVPLFGSHDSDISTHGPSLGANMSVSTHDSAGRNFANSMHIDRDLDSLPELQGKIATMGQWLNIKDGKLIEGEELRRAIPDGFFVLAGYRVAFDLGAAAVVTATWRGGMDMHGTSTSSVNLESNITRWGMSIQTNKKLPNAMRSGRGAIFGAYDRLRRLYEDLFPSES